MLLYIYMLYAIPFFLYLKWFRDYTWIWLSVGNQFSLQPFSTSIVSFNGSGASTELQRPPNHTKSMPNIQQKPSANHGENRSFMIFLAINGHKPPFSSGVSHCEKMTPERFLEFLQPSYVKEEVLVLVCCQSVPVARLRGMAVTGTLTAENSWHPSRKQYIHYCHEEVAFLYDKMVQNECHWIFYIHDMTWK